MERVLVVAGFDPSGGAGLLMDTKILTLLGFKVASLPTALTFQNSRRFEGWKAVKSSFFEKMLSITLEDRGIRGVKIGMLASPENLEVLSQYLERYRKEIVWIVLDPVLKATLKKRLYQGKEFIEVLKQRLMPLLDVITPNVDEAFWLTGIEIRKREDLKEALKALRDLGVRFPVITGFREGEKRVSFFLEEERLRWVAKRELPFEFHGTGCALASALLAYLLKGYPFPEALKRGIGFVYKRLLKAVKEERAFRDEGLKIFL